MNFKKIILGTSVSLVMISCVSDQANNKAPMQAPAYPVLTVQKQSATLEAIYPATVKGQEDIEIRPRIDGFIDAIYVDEGSVVKQGQTLFKINSPQAEQAYTTAQASVNSAQAAVNTAKLNVDRIKPLADKGIVSQVQLDTYQNAYETAMAGLSQAKAGLMNAKATLGWTNVTSPVNGIVGTIPFRKGSLVNSANALTTVANTSKTYAYFALNEKQLMILLARTEGVSQKEKIKNLPAITLELSDGSMYSEKGKIETIAGSIHDATGTATFRAEFANPQGILRSGFSGRVHVPQLVENVYVIPQKATFQQQDKVLAYKVQGDSVVQSLITVLNMPDGKSYAVTGGLEEGDRIVRDNLATIRNAMKITPVAE